MPVIKLDSRRFQIFYRLYQGKTDRQIGQELKLPGYTITYNKAQLFKILNVKKRAELPNLARNFKIVLDCPIG
ncbi:hypothetical protein NIES2100_05270 [Calothrix sp. NIES-2100]|uniref:LuxR C-terminal-related transcriptional regulator n=1 Tax=Calothrix sp. NIES-2100 TaxID=1954172 RepID=UPI000B5F4107|nr:hypothetical protein NIES2100_05270 [Calothrix sp. NIES-2100]